MAEIYDQNRIEVPLDNISSNMQAAVLAVEDYRFFDHKGVDPQGIVRAAIAKATGGKSQGASTLTQQWVKNVLLYRAEKATDKEAIRALQNEDYGRKVREIRLALAAEKNLTKKEILQNYLNIANFGDGAYGVEAASQYYFSKSAKDLTVAESALLAGTVQRPTTLSPIRKQENAKNRRDTVLQRMLDVGFISQEQHDEAVATPIADMIKVTEFRNGCDQAGTAAYFCDYVTKVLNNDPAFNYTDAEGVEQQGADLLYRGGLTITTTLDKRMQEVAGKEALETVPLEGTDPDLGFSMVTVQPGTGQIKAMAQNTTYDAKQDNKEPGRTAINYNTSQDYGGSRGWQPGSNMKPIILAEWLKAGHSLDEMVNASPRTLPQESFTRCGSPIKPGLDPWPVRTASKLRGMITVDKATYLSVNPAYAEMTQQLDLCNIVKTAEALGIYRANPHDSPLSFQTPHQIQAHPSMVLGADEVAPLTMAAAYAAFAAEGRYCKPIAIMKMVNRKGEEVPIPQSDCSQALPPHVPAQMVESMRKVFTDGTAGRTGPLAGGRDAAGKTGTTNRSANVWFTGFTPDLSTSIWMGHVSASIPLHNKTVAGKKYSVLYGGTINAPTWKRFMEAAHEGMPNRAFATAAGIDDLTAQEMGENRVPRVYGLSVDAARKELEKKGYIVKVGKKAFSKAPKGKVAGTSPGTGKFVEKGRVVTLLISKGPKPKPTPTETANPTDSPTAGVGTPTSGPAPSGPPTTNPRTRPTRQGPPGQPRPTRGGDVTVPTERPNR